LGQIHQVELEVSMPSSSQECRRQAVALVRLAEVASSPEDKKRFANLAEMWLKLAGDLEEIDTHLQPKAGRKKAG
jgi:hypothetical protein